MDMDRERVKKELAKEVPEYVLELITDTKRRRMDWERGLPALSSAIEKMTGKRMGDGEIKDFARELWEYIFSERGEERILLENPYTDKRFIVIGEERIEDDDNSGEDIWDRFKDFMSVYDKVYLSAGKQGIYIFSNREEIIGEGGALPENINFFKIMGYAEREDINSVLDIWLARNIEVKVKDRDRNIEFVGIKSSKDQIRVVLFQHGLAWVIMDIDKLFRYFNEDREQVSAYLKHISNALHELTKENSLGTERYVSIIVPFEGGMEFDGKWSESVMDKIANHVKANPLSPREYIVVSTMEGIKPLMP